MGLYERFKDLVTGGGPAAGPDNEQEGLFERGKRLVIGAPRDIRDPRLFHKVSLIAFLAWVGLGADGLSSSAYGPDEAFRALVDATGVPRPSLAIFLALATAITVGVISYAYSRTIEQFPQGGGYAVATKLLGPTLGARVGVRLLVDYVLTIAVSIVSGADQIFSMLPLEWHYMKMPLVALGLAGLVIMNLRGVKESVKVIAPIFVLFLISHAVLLGGIGIMHSAAVPARAHEVAEGLSSGVSSIGIFGMLMVLASAYARGAGTYTGIEAVSNAVQIMREPKVPTAQRTMVYMAVSLAVVAGGILLGYMLLGISVEGETGKTLNAILCERLGLGQWFVVLTLLSEAALLALAAQTGFIGGPRVMANMAADSWIPHRFTSLSERMSLQDGVLLMGLAAVATLIYTRGNITALVTMYAINVFITFSLTQFGMCRHWVHQPRSKPHRRRRLIVHGVGAFLCTGILVIVIIEKFTEGAWVTLVVTALLVLLCFLIRYYYRRVRDTFARFAQQVEALPAEPALPPARDAPDPDAPTAALLVSGYSGLGIHSFLTILRLFPKTYHQVIFVSVGVIDSGSFKGVEEVERLQKETEENLQKYIALAHRLGLAASAVQRVGIDPVAEAEELCVEISEKYPKTTFFAGQLIFERDAWYHRLLHNETAFAIQRRLQWRGLPLLILPARVMTA